MNFIYIRHGETEFSRNNFFAGRKDIPLLEQTPESIFKITSQIRHYPSPTKIYHSPLLRAVQTKNIIINELNLTHVESFSNDMLIERDFGEFEGKEKNIKNRDALVKGIAVEPFDLVKERARLFIMSTMADDNFWIIGHSSFYRALKEITEQNSLPLKINCGQAIHFRL
ncbi:MULTISPECIES: histidine phosphatase family protein [Aeromonas]|uniref:histidine phosphatase family protein n=1 Tax=Aeromonas TaxID=642 RepID=UPI0028577737|nr:histidine phosphatase family protein [Aeromonas salmonicida]MDR6995422.1 broad specificity phosphatase PhoE [Aeromonas salmonicida]